MKERPIPHEIIQPTENLDVRFRLFEDTGSFVSSHWHNSLEIIYITSGSLHVKIGSQTFDLHEDDCILINSSVVHATHCIDGNTSIMLQVPSPFLKRYMPDYDSCFFDLAIHSKDGSYQVRLAQLKKILKDMEAIEILKPEAGSLHFNSLLFELLFLLYHHFRIPGESLQQPLVSSSLTMLEPVLEYTNLHYSRPIAIQEVADIAHLQPQYFCRKFKLFMGQTYLEYLNEIRLSHIYADLLNKDTPLYEILENHGFTNYKLFRKIFREKFGCTPGEIRSRREKT
ncbi:AraC family transcriptional regulator [Anaerobium acetethylicum]|uniref:AraC-type DNA-binding protein n=1 Tax=Anaerobium acetethylicum TaxID=1619234 RepID=A0A1D3TY24_9FIRM|nr:AraC family transcriptional regulator [Anaerobium acetethylicum]SCP99283.1 AraC-type DNA-binding protein [Anaerobium acetethylicum]